MAFSGLVATILVLAPITGVLAQSSNSRTSLTRGVWAIEGATILPLDRDSVFRNATILIRDGRIADVGPASSVNVPGGARRIDGTGKWVIPGLVDMHAHLYADEWVPDSVAPYELGVYLAQGVTTARLMIGTPVHHRLRADLEAGKIIGPQLWIASPQFAGRNDPNSQVVTTAQDARRAVREMAAAGYDFIKLTVDITPEVYDAVTDEAARLGIRVVGHVDPRVGVARALGAKQQIEHLDAYMESVLVDSAVGRPSVSDVGAYRLANWETIDLVDARKVEALAGATARAGIYVTPTLAFFRLWFATRQSDEEVRSRPDYGHIPAKMRDGYERARAQYWKNPPSAERRAKYIAIRNRMVKSIVDSGGHIMAGSDGPGGLMGYGWSLHRELAMLVDAGLSPMQALSAATRVPAQYIGADREWGTLQRGKRADLVLLDGDPLADIRNTSRITAVSVGGRLLERRELERMVEQAHKRLNP
jgi:cytosine/adenosine deaminase-related metal-dependent hydrolase